MADDADEQDDEQERTMTPEERRAAARARMDGDYEPPILREPDAAEVVTEDMAARGGLTNLAELFSGAHADARAEFAADDALDAALLVGFGDSLKLHFEEASYAPIDLPEPPPARPAGEPDFTIDKFSIVDTITDSNTRSDEQFGSIADAIREGMS